ncbi:MAG: single-stranded DNA-binding protein [bacterium]
MANLKMPEINIAMMAGNLTSDPSFRKTSNGTPVANFYIASNRRFKDNNGNWRENVCYIGVVAWHKLAESCYENLQKGSAVLIDGEIQSRTWKNADGSTKNVVEIKARRIQFLNKRDSSYKDTIVEEEAYELIDKKESSTPLEDSTDGELEKDDKAETDKLPDEKQDDLDFGYRDLKL